MPEPIDYERARVQKLQSEIHRLEQENAQLKHELQRSLTEQARGASAS